MALTTKSKTRMRFVNAVGFVRVMMHRDVNSMDYSRYTEERCRYSIVSSLPEYVKHDIPLGEAALLFIRATDTLKRQWQGYLDKHPELNLYPFVSNEAAGRGAKA